MASDPKSIDKACQPNWQRPVSETKLAAVPATEDQVRGIFRRYDANKDGRLNKQELKDAFSYLGSRLPGVRALLALRNADANGDGFISEAEFENLVKYTMKRGYKFK